MRSWVLFVLLRRIETRKKPGRDGTKLLNALIIEANEETIISRDAA